MPRVFISQQPSRLDRTTNTWVPTVDISQAAAIGEPIIMLPPNAGWLTAAEIGARIRQALNDNKFTFDDYLLMLGSPVAMASSVALASRIIAPAPLRLLVWDRMSYRYIDQMVRTQ